MYKSWVQYKKALNLYLTFSSVIFIKISITKCDQIEYKLVHTIFKDYDPSIRPSLYHNSTLNVTFGLALTQLIDVVSKQFFFLNSTIIINKFKLKFFIITD